MSERAFDQSRATGAEAKAEPRSSMALQLARSVSRRAQSRDIVQGLNGAVVQRAGAGGGADAVHRIAAAGVSGSGGALPHGDRIQAAFGRHDVSQVQAHVGGAAADAAAAIGAEAYTTGDRVAFAESPDLHTAAHEAAHTVQQSRGVQLRGGVGEEGDRYEQHADAVADRVVRGESAEALLDAGPSGGAGVGGVQRAAVQLEAAPAGGAREGAGQDAEGGEAKEEPWWKLAPEVSLKPPLLTGFNTGAEVKIAVDPAGAVSGSGVVNGKEAKDFTGSKEFGTGPVMAKVLLSGEFGVKAAANVQLSGQMVKHEDDPSKDYVDLTITSGGNVEFFASGKIAAGPAIGVPDVANASLMAYGQLEGKLSAGAAFGGGLRWGKDGLKGTLKMPFNLDGTIQATGGILLVVEFVKEDVELAELKLVEADIAKAGVKATPTVTMPGGAISGDTPEVTEPTFILGSPKVKRLKNLIGPKMQQVAMDLERQRQEWEAAAARSEADYQAARQARMAELGVDELTPEQEVCPLPGEDEEPRRSSEPGPNASGV